MLGQKLTQINERWLSGVERYLVGSQGELPEEGRALLAVNMLRSTSGSSRGRMTLSTNLSIGELKLAEDLKFLISRGQATQALQMYRRDFGESVPTPSSPLFVLIARAHFQVGDISASERMAKDGISYFKRHSKFTSNYVDLLLLLAQIYLTDAAYSASTNTKRGTSLWTELVQLTRVRRRSVQSFRVAIHILAVFHAGKETKASRLSPVLRPPVEYGSTYYFSNSKTLLEDDCRACLLHIREELARLPLLNIEIDGVLLLRAFSILGAYFPEDKQVRTLLTIESANRVLRNEFQDALNLTNPKSVSIASVLEDFSHRVGQRLSKASLKSLTKLLLDGSQCTDFDIYLLAYLLRREFEVRDKNTS